MELKEFWTEKMDEVLKDNKEYQDFKTRKEILDEYENLYNKAYMITVFEDFIKDFVKVYRSPELLKNAIAEDKEKISELEQNLEFLEKENLKLKEKKPLFNFQKKAIESKIFNTEHDISSLTMEIKRLNKQIEGYYETLELQKECDEFAEKNNIGSDSLKEQATIKQQMQQIEMDNVNNVIIKFSGEKVIEDLIAKAIMQGGNYNQDNEIMEIINNENEKVLTHAIDLIYSEAGKIVEESSKDEIEKVKAGLEKNANKEATENLERE